MKGIRIPRDVIYNDELTVMRVAVYVYLAERISYDDKIRFSLNDFCKWVGKTPDRNKGAINDRFINVISEFQRANYISSSFEPNEIKKHNGTVLIECQYNDGIFKPKKNYGTLYFDEISKILNIKDLVNENSDIKRISVSHLFLVAAYIKVNLNTRENNPLCCYRYNKTIAKELGINERYVAKCLSVLSEVQVIDSKTMPRKKHVSAEGNVTYLAGPTVFASSSKYVWDGDTYVFDENYCSTNEIQEQIGILDAQYEYSIPS